MGLRLISTDLTKDLEKTIDQAMIEYRMKISDSERLRAHWNELMLLNESELNKICMALAIGEDAGKCGVNIQSLTCPREEFERRKDCNEL